MLEEGFTPLPVQTTATPCADDCYDMCELEHAVAEAEYALALSKLAEMVWYERRFHIRVAHFNYMQSLENVTANYDECIGGCS